MPRVTKAVAWYFMSTVSQGSISHGSIAGTHSKEARMSAPVIRRSRRIAVVMIVLLLLLPMTTAASLASVSAATEQARIYLVAMDDNGQSGMLVGCGDSLIPVTVDVTAAATTEGKIRAALEHLLALRDPFYGQSGLYNALYENTLTIEKVEVQNGVAGVTLSGEHHSRGTCDDPRIQGQIEQTILHVPGITRVVVILNGGPLVDAIGGPNFPQTGHSLRQPFYFFWRDNGGLPVFGYPLSEQVFEGAHRVQYFERQRFEHHPENSAPYTILLGRLGHERAQQLGLLNNPAFQRQQPNGNPNCEYFPETGHHLCFGFRTYWHAHGLDFGDAGVSFRESLLLFGYPISEEFIVNGRTVQYFERARFEWHPENAAPWDILLGRLGAEVYGK
jgi:hypothetical protein